MTTAVESVSTAVRGYVASVSGGVGTLPDVFDALARYVVGGLEPGESVLRVECLRNPRPNGTAAALAVLTDRAVLLAEEGVAGQRISLSDISDVRGVDVEYGGVHHPALDLFHAGGHDRIVAAPVDAWNYELARSEMQTFLTTMSESANRLESRQPTAVEQAPVATSPVSGHPVAAAPPAAPGDAARGGSGSTAYGQARFVGDAAPVGGIPLSRLFNAICYVIAGIALVVMSQLPGFPGGGSMALAIVIGLGSIAYGAKIVLTRSSYWVSSWVYLLAFGSVAAMFGFLAK